LFGADPTDSPSNFHPSVRADVMTVEDVENAAEAAEDEDEDEDEDEVVFGGEDVGPHRRVSATHVDPNAPTPPSVNRSERKYQSSSEEKQQRTPPQTQHASDASQAAFLASPSYQVDGQGLLDDY
jgi:hypothetical protein